VAAGSAANGLRHLGPAARPNSVLRTVLDADRGDSSGAILVRYGYDQAGNLSEVVNSSGQPMRFEYDLEGRMTAWQDRRGTRYEYTYDGAGRCVAGQGSENYLSRTFAYNPSSTVETDSLGHSTVHHLNDRHQVVRVVNPLGHARTYEWDELDRLMAQTDELGRTTQFEYDEHGNLVQVVRPDESRRRITYNDLHLPMTLVDYDHSVWEWRYDEHGNRYPQAIRPAPRRRMSTTIGDIRVPLPTHWAVFDASTVMRSAVHCWPKIRSDPPRHTCGTRSAGSFPTLIHSAA
jgi:YD repeat-containing protein